MAVERTLSILKPDATRRNLTGAIIDRFEKAGLRVVAQKRMRLSRSQAEAFYAVHQARPFFNGLVEFMTSGPVVVQVLEGENAVLKNREVMGATDPAKAAPGTIRKDFAENIEAVAPSPLAQAVRIIGLRDHHEDCFYGYRSGRSYRCRPLPQRTRHRFQQA